MSTRAFQGTGNFGYHNVKSPTTSLKWLKHKTSTTLIEQSFLYFIFIAI